MNQTKKCLIDYKDAKLTRVIPKGWFRPKDLEWKSMIHMETPEFLEKFKLQQKT
jgi:hypothetical protein